VATPESKVKKQVKEILKNLGAYYVMPVTSGYGNSGAPDFLVCIRGKFIGIECKSGKKKPTALQLKNLDLIDKAGGWTFVINEENVSSLVNLDSLT
jgi:Holliday junction resolvase